MTPDQITQIRHKLGLALAAYKNRFYHTSANYIFDALALLPCPTCNGSGKTSKLFEVCPECGCKEYTGENLAGEGYRQCSHCRQDWWTYIKYDIPCPNCQQHSS